MAILTPLNDLLITVFLEDIDPSTFSKVPLTTGTVTVFLATSSDPTATAADPSLSVTATHIGTTTPNADEYPNGTWGAEFDAATLTPSLLNSKFGSAGVAYVVVQSTGTVRVYDKLRYVDRRRAEIA